MAFNYKQYETAKDIETALKFRLVTTPSFVESSTDTVVTFGSLVAGAGGGSIVILDQRGGVDAGFDNIIGQQQSVYTTGVCKIILEARGSASGGANAGTAATGNFALLNVVALKAVTVAGVTFTEGTDWAKGADDNAAAIALKNAINAKFTGILTAASVASGNVGVDPSHVNLTANSVGTWGNSIGITSNDASMVASAATLTGGLNANSGGTGTFCTPANYVAVLEECGRRGMRVELYYTDAGTAPTFANLGAATLMAAFEPHFWSLSGRV